MKKIVKRLLIFVIFSLSPELPLKEREGRKEGNGWGQRERERERTVGERRDTERGKDLHFICVANSYFRILCALKLVQLE